MWSDGLQPRVYNMGDDTLRERIQGRIREERPDYWIELGPRPAEPDHVEVLSHKIYVGPTLENIRQHQQNSPSEQPIPEVSVVEEPDRPGTLQIQYSVQFTERQWEAMFDSD